MGMEVMGLSQGFKTNGNPHVDLLVSPDQQN